MVQAVVMDALTGFVACERALESASRTAQAAAAALTSLPSRELQPLFAARERAYANLQHECAGRHRHVLGLAAAVARAAYEDGPRDCR
jgi:hypothetical protein